MLSAVRKFRISIVKALTTEVMPQASFETAAVLQVSLRARQVGEVDDVGEGMVGEMTALERAEMAFINGLEGFELPEAGMMTEEKVVKLLESSLKLLGADGAGTMPDKAGTKTSGEIESAPPEDEGKEVFIELDGETMSSIPREPREPKDTEISEGLEIDGTEANLTEGSEAGVAIDGPAKAEIRESMES